MNRLIFNRDEYDLIYNCSMKTPEEWYAYGKKNLPLGLFYIISGIIYELFYIPVLTVMLQKEFFQHASYKIMFVMGVIDVITLIEICFFNGYDTLVGDVFCVAPTRVYLISLVSTFGWYCGTLLTTVLALDRCLQLLFPNTAKILFKDNRAMVWVVICIFYGLINFWFQYPFLYNSHYGAVFYSPHFGDEFYHPIDDPLYYAHNLTMVSCICLFYTILCVGWACKYKDINAPAVSFSQRLINIQAFMISMEIVGSGLMCIYFQNFYVPDFLYIVNHVLWQMSHGDDGILLLLINKSIRDAVIRLFNKVFRRKTTTSIFVTKYNMGVSVNNYT